MKLASMFAAVALIAVTGTQAQFPGFKKAAKPAATNETAKTDAAQPTPAAKTDDPQPAAAPAAPAFNALPFGVTLGGQAAAGKAGAIFATVDQPVADNAALAVTVENPDMVIVNAFPADDAGKEIAGAAPHTILIQKSNKGTLDQTVDKKPLPAGNYLMNVMAGGQTARVFFKVK